MAGRHRRQSSDSRVQWLRVGAVAVGLGAAVTAGQGVAAAAPADSPDGAPSASSADTGSVEANADSTATTVDAGSASRKASDSKPAPSRQRNATVTAQRQSAIDARVHAKRQPSDPLDTPGLVEAANEPRSSGHSEVVTTDKHSRTRERQAKLRTDAESRGAEADTSATTVSPRSGDEVEVVSPHAFIAASTPAPPITPPKVVAARPAVAPVVTIASIVTDTLDWIGLGHLANDLSVPALPVGPVVESLWLAVRENHYGPARQGTVAQSAVPNSTVTTGANPDPVDLGDLLARPGVTVGLKADGTIDVLTGAFTDAAVTSGADAARVFNGLAPLLGASAGFAHPDDIVVQRVNGGTTPGDVSETFYRLRGNIDGTPVLGSDAILVTDGSGTVTALFNDYDSRVNDVDVTVDRRVNEGAEAAAMASAAYLNSSVRARDPLSAWVFATFSRVDPELEVYALDAAAPPRLVWRVVVAPPRPLFAPPKPSATYYIYANGSDAGTVMTAISNAQGLSAVTVSANDVLGQRRTINVTKQAAFFFQVYKMQDLSRNITTYKTSYGFLGLGAPVIPSSPLSKGWLGWNAAAVSAQANIAEVYDYYDSVLGLRSFDGNGAAIKLVVEYNPTSASAPAYDNAYWDPDNQQLVFGDGDDLEGAVDVVGHEFTHAVVSYVVGQGGSVLDDGESGALNEAYADIMGSLIEGKSGADRWLIGEDSKFAGGAVRNLADPSSLTTVYGPYRESYGDRYTGTGDDGGEHVNSTIFSHAAYEMMTADATSGISEATWAAVFYHSLYRLSSSADFADGRAAVLDAAAEFGFTAAQLGAIGQAFDSAGIGTVALVMV